MPFTLFDFIRTERAKGADDQQIAESFKARYGMSPMQVNPDMDLTGIGPPKPPKPPEPTLHAVKRGAKGLAHLALGVMDPLTDIMTPGLPGVGVRPDYLQRTRQAIEAGERGFLQTTYDPRKRKHPVTNIQRELIDIALGPSELAHLVKEAATRMTPQQAYETGAQISGGAVGGALALAKKFVKDPWEATKTAPVTFALAVMPYAKAMPVPKGFPRPIKRGLRRFHESPRAKNIHNELFVQMQAGKITPGEAASRYQRLVPVAALAKKLDEAKVIPDPTGAGLAGVLGAMVTDGYLDPATAALVGSSAYLLKPYLKKVIPKEHREWFANKYTFFDPAWRRRKGVDFTAQRTPGETDIARGATIEAERSGKYLATLFREFAGRVRSGKVFFEALPEDPKARKAATRARQVEERAVQVGPAGKMVDDSEAMARLGELDAEAARLSTKKALKTIDKEGSKRLKEIEAERSRLLESKMLQPRDLGRAPFLAGPKEASGIIASATEVLNQRAPTGGPMFRNATVAGWFTDAMLREGLTLARNPYIRGIITNDLSQRFPKNKAAIAKSLDDLITKTISGELRTTPESLSIRLPDGTRKGLTDLIGEAVDTVRKEGRKDINDLVAGAIERVGQHVSTQAAKRITAMAVAEEFRRTRAVRIPGKEIPQHISPAYVQALVAKGEVPPMVVPNRLWEGLPDNMKARYVDVPEPVRRMVKEVGLDISPDAKMTRGFADTLTTQIKAYGYIEELEDIRRSVQASDTWLQRAAQTGKLGLTALRIGTHVNNLTGNFLYQVFRRGISPMSLMLEMRKDLLMYRQYTTGKMDDAAQLREFRAIGKTGAIDTSLVAEDMRSLAHAARTASPLPTDLPPVKVAGKEVWSGQFPEKVHEAAAVVGTMPAKAKALATRVYRFGDTAAKLNEMRATMRLINKNARSMRKGKTGEFDIRGGRVVKFKKLDDATVEIDGKRVKLDSQEWADLTAESGAKTASDIFFDYGLGGTALKGMKGELLRAVHPFFAWTHYASDIPGVKKGLMSHMLDYAGAGVVRTDDATLIARNVARAAQVSLMRSAMMEAMRSVEDSHRDIAGESLGFGGGQAHVLSAWRDIHPGVVNVHERPGLNMLDPSSKLLQFGPTLMHAWFGKDWALKKYAGTKEAKAFVDKWHWLHGTPEQFLKEQKKVAKYWGDYEAGRGLKAEHALEVVGFGGGLWAEELIRAMREDRPINWKRFGIRLARMTMGGTPTDAVDAIMTQNFPEEWGGEVVHPVTGDAESNAELWARKLFTLGVRPVDLEDRKKQWLTRRRTRLNREVRAMEKRIELRAKRGQDISQELAALKMWVKGTERAYARIERVVDDYHRKAVQR